MPKVWFIFALFFLCFHTFPSEDKSDQNRQVNVSYTSNQINVNFALSINDISKSSEDVVSFAKDINLTNTLKRAKLPYQVITVFSKLGDIKVEYELGDEYEYDGSQLAFETIKKYRCGNHVRAMEPDEEFHQKNLTPFYTIETLGDFRNMPISRVIVYPIRYSIKEKRFLFYPNIKFTISDKHQSIIQSNMTTIYETMNNRYLIVSPRVYLDKFITYADYKRSHGFEVDLVAKEELGNNFYEIKASLKKRYLNPLTRFSYAMLVGHENMFPTEYVKTSSSDQTPSDHNYFTFGEDQDAWADVIYSRMTIKNEQDLEGQLEKFMDYEAENNMHQDVLALASDEGENPSDKEMMETLLQPISDHYQINRMFQEDSETTALNVIKAFSSDLRWIYYLGHGTGNAWTSLFDNKSFTTLDMRKISYNQIKPVLIDISCSNGRFSINKFGERFLNTNNQAGESVGVASYFGGTVSISWQAPAIMAQGISQNSLSSKTLGEAILKGKFYLLNHYSDLAEIKDTFLWMHLQGDPTLTLDGI